MPVSDQEKAAKARDAALQGALTQIEREFGKGTVMRMGDEGAQVRCDAIPTGALSLDLALGYSHPILYDIPEGIKITVVEGTKVTIEGADKQLVGEVTASIRAYYPPEPYKGKGVRIVGERVRRKEGKTVA